MSTQQSKFKVVITTPTFAKFSDEPIEILSSANCEIITVSGAPDPELKKIIRDADAIIVGLEKITAEIINTAQKLKIIAKHGVGVDNIDINAAKACRVIITNCPGANADAVADHTLGLMIAVSRQTVTADSQVRAGNWPKLFGIELTKKTFGVIGIGAVGKSFILRLSGFDPVILGYDMFIDNDFCSSHDINVTNIDDIVAKSDFISIHVPLTHDTYGLISRSRLQAMKSTAILINTARGGIVDEKALVEALQNGWIAGAALDVFEEEPLPIESPLRNAPNLVLTPHIGGYTREALTRTSIMAAKSVVDVLSNKGSIYAL